MRIIANIRVAVVFAAAIFLVSRVSAEYQLTLLDGRQLKSAEVAIAKNGDISAAGVSETLNLTDVQSISIADIKPVDAGIILNLVGGGHLNATSFTIADDKCQVEPYFGRQTVIPLENVRAVRFDSKNPTEAFSAAVVQPSAESDRLFIKANGQTQAISGLIESMSNAEVKFEWQGKNRTMPRTQFYGVAFAQAPETSKPLFRASLVDGSVLLGKFSELTKTDLNMTVGTTKISVPIEQVGQFELRSDRVQYLSDIEKIEAIENTVVAFPKKFSRDRSVSGAPLQIGKQRFAKGIGVHANSRLTFALDGRAQQFVALVGLDAAAGGKGDCVFRVEVDGSEVFSKRIKGNELAAEVRLELADANELTLIVEAGENLDLADHADWANARIIRASK